MFLFQLGSNVQLSLAELESVFSKDKVKQINNHVALVETQDCSALELQSILGGTIKIGEVIYPQTKLDQNQIEQKIADFLTTQIKDKLTFAVAELDRDHLPKLDLTKIKRLITQNSDKNIRYIESSRAGLSAAVLLHQTDVVEVLVCRDRMGNTIIGKTVTVQDIDTWSLRDRGKPETSHKRGLLPPKIARILVNLSLGQDVFNKTNCHQYCLLDPFCGSGTIPFEAITMCFGHVYGSDISKEAVAQAQANYNWFQTQFVSQSAVDVTAKFFISDVAQINQYIEDNTVSHLVTEPFLGKQTPQINQVPDIAKGLEKLYLGAFKSWQTILKPQAKIVIIFPNWIELKNPYSWQNLVAKIANFGYTSIGQPIIYQRPSAKVLREIWQFELHK